MLRLTNNSEKLLYLFFNYPRQFSSSGLLAISHYDVLNLNRNCTSKEIRDAYLKLCKKYHPDRNKKDLTLHKKFLRVSEAYNVLIKPNARRRYDESLRYVEGRKIRPVIVNEFHHSDDFRRAWSDPAFFHNRKNEFRNSESFPDDEYYGIKGIKRVSNSTLFVLLVGISIFCGFVQIIAIKNSLMRSELRQLTEDNAKILQDLQTKYEGMTENEVIEDIERTYNENLEKFNYPTSKRSEK